MASQALTTPLEDLSIESITDWTIKVKIQKLQDALPWASVLQCKDALLLAKGNFDNAAELLALDECPICKEGYNDPKNPQEPRILYCGHIFCQHCIFEWFDASENIDCPLCRSSQLHPSCRHLCSPRPVADHPPLRSRTLTGTCIDCIVADFSQEYAEEIVAEDAIYQEQRKRYREQSLEIFSVPEAFPRILQPGLRDRLKELDKEIAASRRAVFERSNKRLEKVLMTDRW